MDQQEFGAVPGVGLLFLIETSLLLNGAIRGRRLGVLAASLLVLLTAGAREGGQPPVRLPALAGAGPAASQPRFPAFRLGTAAGPLGWSTAIGDFNTDGTPDVAVADRLLRPVSGASYQIEFAVSGRESRTVAFDSPHGALTLGVSDVDHDNDLDVVITAPLSREIVAVWLNDGQGGFHASDARPFASEIGDTHSVDAADLSANRPVASPSGHHHGYPQSRSWTPPAPRPSPLAALPVRLHAARFASAAPPRAPPPAPPSFC